VPAIVACPRDVTASHAALLFGLGGEVWALPVPSTEPGWLEIGTLAGVPMFSGTAAGPATGACARRLARRGKPSIVLARHPAGRTTLLAVAIAPVRVIAVSDPLTEALPLQRLARAARANRGTVLEHAIALAQALDIDAAGRRTFRILHRLIDRAVEALPRSIAVDDRHTWALAQITRLLFLRFVEAEGWLDNNTRFLAESFDRCLIARRDPTRHLLHPLFFGTLNRPADARSRLARSFGAVPFLNGGLFEPHAVERRYRMQLPGDYWQEVFVALIDRVDVTLDHTADDGRVTPEMLGRVFEGVMEPAERRVQGTFFTPPALVDGILREALVCHLAIRMRRSEVTAARAIDDPDPATQRMLLDITVLDPAVGSGAFLVAALDRLHGPGGRQPLRVRHLITRRLFGVDRHPGAVRLCELRLWLEVLRSMRGRNPGRVPPLPNLDASVRAGDALLDPMAQHPLAPADVGRLAQRQLLIGSAHGPAKRAAIADARQLERTAIVHALGDAEAVIDREIAALVDGARAPTLFGDRAAISDRVRASVRKLRQERRALRQERRRITRDSSALPFALAAAFAPVLARRGGFDLVVGNPPWVRAERLPESVRDHLQQRYRWWRSGSTGSWGHLPDLSVAFVERAYQLLATDGTLALLLPGKLATAGYARTCRGELALRSTIHCVADLSDDPRAGFEATTYPLALLASRRTPTAGHSVRLGLLRDAPAQRQDEWIEAPAWNRHSPAIRDVSARLQREFPRLGEQIQAQLGVKTGINAAFIDPPAAVRQWCRPAIRGRDLRPFISRAGAVLLWPASERGVPWTSVPRAIAEHLEPFAAALARRADQRSGPLWQLFRTRAATAPHRVIWRDLAHRLEAATATDPQMVPLNSCYVAAVASAASADSLTAWLNSTPVRALARLHAEAAAGGYARFGARVVGDLPLPAAVLGDATLAALAQSAQERDIQETLDEYVADWLRLSLAERELLHDLATSRR
jgi:hypothetical protein